MKKNSPVYIILFMVAITLICGTAIAFVQSSMKQTLEANARLVRNRTIASAFNLTAPDGTAEAFDRVLADKLTRDTLKGSGTPIEVFTSGDGSVGFVFIGMGFWDYITGIMVLSPDFSQIEALRIIEQKETPGLGARITEEKFTGQFTGFPLRLATEEEKQFAFGEPADESGRKIDALTGATQTSIALERIINSELSRFKTLYNKRNAAPHAAKSGE